MATNERKDRIAADVERLLLEYAKEECVELGMPVVEDWALVATMEDLADDDAGKWLYLRGRNQSTHRTVGLLTMMMDTLRGVVVDDV